jgi:NADH-quinone oxidoreductase subunit M
MTNGWLLTALLAIPLVGMAAVAAAPAHRARWIAVGAGALTFVVSLPLWFSFAPGVEAFQFETRVPWIEDWGIAYHVGVDGISVLLVLLTTLLMPVTMLGSFRYITQKERTFYAMMLLLETGVIGVFVALDLFLFFVFWELVLVPMYLIIGIWGGQRRVYAAIKFFLFTAAGSLLMLVGILYLFFKYQALSGAPSFAYIDLLQVPLTLKEQLWLFGAFALAFAIKVPLFPLHTWLPDAHVEAPTPGSVILAAVLLKMGTYGFVRFLLPFFPLASTHPDVVTTLMVLGVVGIVYAAWVAAVQPDAKKLIAYTSVAHMGFVVIGVFAITVIGLQGAMIVMLSHGISTGAMFLLLGMLYERRHTRLIEDYGGLAAVTPMLATAFVVTALASIGVPGTSGFVGEFLALLGTFETHPFMAIFAGTGVIFAAYYMLPMVQRIFFNRVERPENERLADLSVREGVVLAPLLALMVWMGVQPAPFLRRMEASVSAVVERVQREQLVAPIADRPGGAVDVRLADDDPPSAGAAEDEPSETEDGEAGNARVAREGAP